MIPMTMTVRWVPGLAVLLGGMLAGGCAVGAGVSGASVFALTAWISLIGMWAGAGLTNHLLDRPKQQENAAAFQP